MDENFVALKVEYTEEISSRNEGNESYRGDTKTLRILGDILYVPENNNDFNTGGNFTVEELTKNDGVVYVYTIESNSNDSFGVDTNKFIEFVEVFLTEEKSERAREAVRIQEKALKVFFSYDNDDVKSEKLKKLTEQLKECGIDKDLTKNTKENPISSGEYLAEDDTVKKIFIDINLDKYSDFIYLETVKNLPELNMEVKSKSKNKP